MAEITIETNYDGYATWDAEIDEYVKHPAENDISVGQIADKYHARGFFRFPLNNLPSGSDVTETIFRVHCHANGGAAHEATIGAYGSNGQDDPETDSAENCFVRSRCSSPHCYIELSDAFRSGCSLYCEGEQGWKEFNLGSQGCTDIENAKSAVNRFSIGMYEYEDNDPQVLVTSSEYGTGCVAELKITYTPPAPPAGYQYSDGLVSVSVLAMLMRKAILSVCGQVAG